MKKIKDFLSYTFNFGEDLHISVQTLLIVILAIFISSYLLRIARRLITRKLPEVDKAKFVTVFGYLKWLIYLVIFLQVEKWIQLSLCILLLLGLVI